MVAMLVFMQAAIDLPRASWVGLQKQCTVLLLEYCLNLAVRRHTGLQPLNHLILIRLVTRSHNGGERP
jgi:hypothetical protein